ncbi:MAG: GNAT family N-acetyltransferase [Bacteroidales bacterium]|jgi:diamine N-acetyltransferase|nr:GNAT family N-acetyltransferase [Bacteroidales bacterium]
MKVVIRAVEIKDADIIYKWENDFSLWEISSTRMPYSHYAIEQYVKNTQNEDIYSGRQARFMIDIDKEDGTTETIGCIDLYDFDPQHQRAGVGIFIEDGPWRRKHIALEVLDRLWNYAITILNLHQLYCHIPSYNTASRKLFSKAKYQHTATLKDWLLSSDKTVDIEVYQKIKNKK